MEKAGIVEDPCCEEVDSRESRTVSTFCFPVLTCVTVPPQPHCANVWWWGDLGSEGAEWSRGAGRPPLSFPCPFREEGGSPGTTVHGSFAFLRSPPSAALGGGGEGNDLEPTLTTSLSHRSFLYGLTILFYSMNGSIDVL